MNETKIKEIFKPVTIKGYEHLYEVSNLGNVRSLRHNKTLKPSRQFEYVAVTLCDNNKRRTEQVHRLVAGAFLKGYREKGKKVVHHINHNGTDNRVENLKIVTHRTNVSLRKKDNGLPTGVEKRKNRYKAGIVMNGKKVYLGSFETPEEAGNAYQKALRKYLEIKL